MIKTVIAESKFRTFGDICIVASKQIDKAMTKCAKQMARKIRKRIHEDMLKYG